MKNLLILGCIGLVAYSIFRSNSGEVPFPMQVMTQDTGSTWRPKSERIRVVLFTGTSWCPACKKLDSSVISKPAWKEFAENEIYFTSYDFPTDRSLVSDRALDLQEEYNVKSFPTMVVLNENFEKIDQFVGSGPPVENFKHWIRAHRE